MNYEENDTGDSRLIDDDYSYLLPTGLNCAGTYKELKGHSFHC